MSWLDASSDGISMDGIRYYSVGKYPIRKQWSLNVTTPSCLGIAAYFRTEAAAREFADTFGLTITDHRKQETP